MGYKVLYRKYRPNDFNQLVGQKPIKEALINSIIKNQLSHAYIFTGPRGTGKTSTAKIFAKTLTCLESTNGICCGKCVNCLSFNENPDIIEIDAASNNGVDEIREIRNNVKLVPTMSKYKIYIVDEVHMLSNSAWNAFLKTLEEPPAHVIFIFATTEINKVPITVLSRCQRYDFHKILKSDIKEYLEKIAKNENFTMEDAALNEIVKLSDGCLRDALSYLDQLSKMSTNITLHLVSDVFGIISSSHIEKLLTTVSENNINDFLKTFDKIMDDGIDCNILINELIDFSLKEAIKLKKRENSIMNFETYSNLINDLLEIQKRIKYVDVPYKVLEMKFLNYFNTDIINEEKSQKAEDKKKIISREIIIENKEKNISREIKSNEFLDKLKVIRINNVFCGANKELKNKFFGLWKSFLEKENDLDNYNLLSYLENVLIEVVSDKYVLFSTKLPSDSIMFNNNLSMIEKEFLNLMNIEYKFIALNNDEWLKEKTEFIKNKNLLRKIMSEDDIGQDYEKDLTMQDAEDIFGDIIEIN